MIHRGLASRERANAGECTAFENLNVCRKTLRTTRARETNNTSLGAAAGSSGAGGLDNGH